MITEKLRTYLSDLKLEYREITHDPTKTSEESAAARGEPLRIGGKALVLKLDDEYKLFVLSAALKLNSKAIKNYFKKKEVRFATPDELFELTGLVPGSVPPFGQPILPLELYLDKSVIENDRIAFNAGSLTISFILPIADYLKAAKPQLLDFSK